MKIIVEKAKPVLLLFGMTLATLTIVWITNQFRGTSASEIEYVQPQQMPTIEQEETTTTNSEMDTSVPLEAQINEILQSEEMVLAASSPYSCSGDANNYTYIQSESICDMGQGSGDVGFFQDLKDFFLGISGDLVSVNANVVLTKVTVPLELLSGIEVADTNRLISTETPTLKPAGEQIDVVTGNVLLPPGEQIDEYASWTADEPFKFDFSTLFAQDSFVSEEGQIAVEHELPNDCEEQIENNDSNVNPDKSDKISRFILNSVHRYPGEEDEIVETEIIEQCSATDKFVDWNSSEYTACTLSLPARVIEYIKNIPDWIYVVKCTFFSFIYDECVERKNIVVVMSSPFGSDIDCKDGSCINAYMDKRNRKVLAPDTDMGPKYYYMTPCQAIIQGEFKVSDIRCAWDMSHLFKERKVNELDDLPTVETTPDENEYNEFLLKDVKGSRGTERLIQ